MDLKREREIIHKIREIDDQILELRRKRRLLMYEKDISMFRGFKNYAIYVDESEYRLIRQTAYIQNTSVASYLKKFIIDFINDNGKEYFGTNKKIEELSNKFPKSGVRRMITIPFNDEQNEQYMRALDKANVRNPDLLRFIVNKIIVLSMSNVFGKKNDIPFVRRVVNRSPIFVRYVPLSIQQMKIIIDMDEDIHKSLEQYAKINNSKIEKILLNRMVNATNVESIISVPFRWTHPKNTGKLITVEFTMSRDEVNKFLLQLPKVLGIETKYIEGVIIDIYTKMSILTENTIPKQ